jgi:WD40 repeat protein
MLLFKIDAGQGEVLSLAFSPSIEKEDKDETKVSPSLLLLSGGSDGYVKYWNLKKKNCIFTFMHSDAVNSVAFSPDGRYAISGSSDKNIMYLSLDDGSLVRTLSGHKAAVNSVVISPNGKYALSGSSDNTVKYWSLEDGRCIATIKQGGKVKAVAIGPNGKYAITGGVWSRKIGFINLSNLH